MTPSQEQRLRELVAKWHKRAIGVRRDYESEDAEANNVLNRLLDELEALLNAEPPATSITCGTSSQTTTNGPCYDPLQPGLVKLGPADTNPIEADVKDSGMSAQSAELGVAGPVNAEPPAPLSAFDALRKSRERVPTVVKESDTVPAGPPAPPTCCCKEHHVNFGRCLQCPVHGVLPPFALEEKPAPPSLSAEQVQEPELVNRLRCVGGKLRMNLSDAATLNPENFSQEGVRQLVGEWDAIVAKVVARYCAAPPAETESGSA